MSIDPARNQVERFIGGNIENRFALEHQRQVGFTDDDAVNEARYFAIVFTQGIVHKGQYSAARNPGADGYQRAQDAILGCTHLATSVAIMDAGSARFLAFRRISSEAMTLITPLTPARIATSLKRSASPVS